MQILKLSKTVTGKYNLIVLLPDTYSTTKKFPLVVFLPGIGARGDNMDMLWNETPPNVRLAVDAYGLVVVVVQTPDTYNDEVLFAYKYAFGNYSIDPDRKYLTGLSYGGGGTWNFVGTSLTQAKMFDAVAPIATTWTTFNASHVADANLPVWAFHNKYDTNGGTPVSATIKMVADVNEIKPGLASMTIFNRTGHGGWGEAYDPVNPPVDLAGEGITNPTVTLWEWFLMNNATTRIAPPEKVVPKGLYATADFIIKDGIIYLDGSKSVNYKSAKWTCITAPAGVNIWGVNIKGGGWITGSFTPPTNGRYIIRLSVYPETGYGGTAVSTDLTIDYNVENPIPPVFKPTHIIHKPDGSKESVRIETI